MRTVSYRLVDLSKATIKIGFVGENDHTQVVFDSKRVFDDYPNAIPSLTVKPPTGDPYPAVTIRDGDLVKWDVENTDLVHEGNGELQLAFMEGNVVVKTYIAKTTINRSLLPTGEVPTPIQNWIDEANEAIGTISGAVEDAEEARDAAIEAKNDAETAQGKAEDAQAAAEGAQAAVEASAEAAETAAEAAAASATSASGSAESAAASAASIHDDADRAVQAKEDAEDARDNARTYAGNAEQSAGQASASATTATTKAGEASQSAGSASSSASTATTKATEASASATAAGQAKTAAETAQSAAEAAQTAAEAAQSAAEESAEEAAASAASIDPDTIAKIDGYYESMTVGNAEQLVATVGVEDSVPYNFRTSGGNAGIGDREVDKLIGGTVAWNQIIKPIENGKWGIRAGATLNSLSDGVIAFTNTASYGGIQQFGNTGSVKKNHKYLRSVDIRVDSIPTSASGKAVYWPVNNMTELSMPYNSLVEGQWKTFAMIQNASNDYATRFQVFITDNRTTDFTEVKIRNVMAIDLTQMFGATIADYIYSLETATAGAGVAWFRKLFPKPYYAYNAGELMSVNVASHNMVGFNIIDKNNIRQGTYTSPTGTQNVCTDDFIKVVPNATYFWHDTFVKTGNARYVTFFDGAKKQIGSSITKYNDTKNFTFTTPSNTQYIKFYLYNANGLLISELSNADFCINLSWDGERDGEYEPYEKHSYTLGNVELRGIPKLDSDNKLYYDGDTYESDGTVTRKYGIVDLGTLTWSAQGTGSDGGKVWRSSLERTSGPCICPKYSYYGYASWTGTKEGTINTGYISPMLFISDSNYSDADAFKTAMSGVYLVYELATPTTETADPFQNPQIVDDFGTEEYVDRGVATSARDVAIPVGHETTYQANLRAKLEMSPDSPDGDGDYIVRQSNGENTYVPLVIPAELPTTPGEDGTYVLKVTVSSGTPTLSWVSE